jgi:hypothetical protein
VNAPSLLRRLFDRMARPEPQQRMGASMALWRCARPLAGADSKLLSSYLLEALRRCLQALVLSDGACVGAAASRLTSRCPAPSCLGPHAGSDLQVAECAVGFQVA